MKLKTKNSCYTYFRIVGYFDPDVITARLGIVPHESWKSGDHGIATWECGMCDEYDVLVEKQMRKTIFGLLDKIDELNQIRNDFDACFFLEIVPEIYVGGNNPVLSPPLDIIDFCHATRTQIDLDYYIFKGRR